MSVTAGTHRGFHPNTRHRPEPRALRAPGIDEHFAARLGGRHSAGLPTMETPAAIAVKREQR